MFRLGAFSLFGMIVIAWIAVGGPPDDANFNKALAVQMAMVRARTLLSDMNAQQAVEILEEQLPNVNNNPQYLSLLRDGYRAYIRDLHLANQSDLAKRYLDRLCILDPKAGADAKLRPQADTPPHQFEQDPVKPAKLSVFPAWKLKNPFAKTEEAKSTKPAAIRGTSAEAINEDPFERKNQREMPTDQAKVGQARELVSRGSTEFKLARYAEARTCFEQAYAADRSSLETCRESWAYCIIAGVAKTMEQPGAIPGKVPELQKQVEDAIHMAPTKMMAVGQELLQNLEQRAKQQTAAAPVAISTLKVKHMGANREGWQVAETTHFRIFHRQNSEYAERVAQVAESTRVAMHRKWFDAEAIEWTPICELIVHPNAAGYTQMTGVPNNSPGHSRIESDPSGRVTARRLDLRMDIAGMMDAVLPHEATHVVLAGMFDSFHVPRWADEGIAVLSEPDAKIDQHRRNLLKNHKEGHLFGLKELMELKDYPQPRRIGAFYAQSVVLVEFLTQKNGPKVFTDFVKDGLRHGYETALQRHYNMTFTQLDQAWQQQVLNNTERFASK
jgi:tetratricopeptide (TPR) repeat protein